jgi:hypothetical protein
VLLSCVIARSLEIQRLFGQARETAATEKSRLEHLVQDRTHERDHRTADRRLVIEGCVHGLDQLVGCERLA